MERICCFCLFCQVCFIQLGLVKFCSLNVIVIVNELFVDIYCFVFGWKGLMFSELVRFGSFLQNLLFLVEIEGIVLNVNEILFQLLFNFFRYQWCQELCGIGIVSGWIFLRVFMGGYLFLGICSVFWEIEECGAGGFCICSGSI